MLKSRYSTAVPALGYVLAEAFGWHGHHVTKSRDLEAELERAFEESGPSLIVIPIDYRENALMTERLGNIAYSI